MTTVALAYIAGSPIEHLFMANDPNRPERPRVEPEIIPPDRHGSTGNGRRTPWQGRGFEDIHGTQRVYVGRIGPFGIALLLLAIAAVIAVILIAVLGAVLIWIPVVAVAVVIAAFFRLFRR